jgi:hypothetical protein
VKIPGAAIHFALALFICGAGVAQAPLPRPPADISKLDFSSLDKDASAYLTKDETLALADLEGVFDTLDSDRDGRISPSEFSRWARAGKSTPLPADPSTAPTGSAGAQHVPRQ